MAAIQNNMENKKISKTNSSRPQTAAYTKGNLSRAKTGIPGIGGGPTLTKKPKSESSNAGLKGVNQNRIHQLLQNNPSGAAATMNKKIVHQDNFENDIDVERRLDANIENAHRMRKESNTIDTESSMPKHSMYQQEPASSQQDYYIDDEPLLETGMPTEEPVDSDLQDLKMNHDKLVDLILKEEDDLISDHHKFIENTINSVKEQEKLRHEVNLPGSDVEDYIINLDRLLLTMQNGISSIRNNISSFHTHIKQEKDLSSKFYTMQMEQADVAPDLDDY